jgi:hypothetical protein
MRLSVAVTNTWLSAGRHPVISMQNAAASISTSHVRSTQAVWGGLSAPFHLCHLHDIMEKII